MDHFNPIAFHEETGRLFSSWHDASIYFYGDRASFQSQILHQIPEGCAISE
jgi:hypothetical protein